MVNNNTTVLLHIRPQDIREDRIKCYLAHVNARNPKEPIAKADVGSPNEFCSGTVTFLQNTQQFRSIVEDIVLKQGRNTLYVIVDDDNYQLTNDKDGNGILYITPLRIKPSQNNFNSSYVNDEDICERKDYKDSSRYFYVILQFFNPNSLDSNTFRGGGFSSLGEAIEVAKELYIEDQYLRIAYGEGVDIYQYYDLQGNPIQ
jgi:hypothetical protein